MSLMESRKAKEAGAGAGLIPQCCPACPRPRADGAVGTQGLPQKKKKTLCEIQVMLSGWSKERMINICKFYMVWNVAGWCWKCESFSFAIYFTKNVTLWEGREKKTEFGFWRNAQEISPANRSDIWSIKPTETPQFINWPLRKLSCMQKSASNGTKRVPQGRSLCGVWASSSVCQLCHVTLNLLKAFLKHAEVHSPHPRQQVKFYKSVLFFYSTGKYPCPVWLWCERSM